MHITSSDLSILASLYISRCRKRKLSMVVVVPCAKAWLTKSNTFRFSSPLLGHSGDVFIFIIVPRAKATIVTTINMNPIAPRRIWATKFIWNLHHLTETLPPIIPTKKKKHPPMKHKFWKGEPNNAGQKSFILPSFLGLRHRSQHSDAFHKAKLDLGSGVNHHASRTL